MHQVADRATISDALINLHARVLGVCSYHNAYVQFAEGVTKTYDVRASSGRCPAFQALESDDALFSRVRVDVGGRGVVWDDGLSLPSNELFERGTTIDTEFDGLMAASDAAALWRLHESTLRKAIAARIASKTDAAALAQ